MRKIVTRREQLTNHIRHYQRDNYFKMARELSRLVEQATGKKVKVNYTLRIKTIVRNSKLWKILQRIKYKLRI